MTQHNLWTKTFFDSLATVKNWYMNSLCQMIFFTFYYRWNILNLEKFELDERSNFENFKISISNCFFSFFIELNRIGSSMGNVGRVRCFANTMEPQFNLIWLIQTIKIDKCMTIRSEPRSMGECVRNVHLLMHVSHGLWNYGICNLHSAKWTQQCWCIYGMRMHSIEWKNDKFWMLDFSITKMIQ